MADRPRWARTLSACEQGPGVSDVRSEVRATLTYVRALITKLLVCRLS